MNKRTCVICGKQIKENESRSEWLECHLKCLLNKKAELKTPIKINENRTDTAIC